jgi:hypothetical protein
MTVETQTTMRGSGVCRMLAAFRYGYFNVLGLACLLLGGCQSATTAIWQTVAVTAQPGALTPPAVPGVQFLKVGSPAGTAYMVLGDVEPAAGGHKAEVWYSAGRQVLRLERGRLASTAGLPVDWRAVNNSPPPAWSSALAGHVFYMRVRDEVPDYRFGIVERVVMRAAQPPAAAWANALAGRPNVTWFTEEAEPWQPVAVQPLLRLNKPASAPVQAAAPSSREPSQRQALPLAWFAVDLKAPGEPVVFSRQCLSPALCLELQPVPAAPSDTATAPPKDPS